MRDPRTARRPRRLSRGPLRPAEIAEAAVLADLAAILVVVAWLVPLGGLAQLAASVPFAALQYRHRLRAVVVGAIAGGFVTTLIAGPAAAAALGGAALVGFVVGFALKRDWTAGATVLFGLAVAWSVIATLTVGTLAVLSGLRELTLEQFEISYRGLRPALTAGLTQVQIDELDMQIQWIITNWWIVLPAMEALFVVVSVVIARALARPALRRLHDALAPPRRRAVPRDGAVRPVPVRLDDVTYRYPGASVDSLHGVTLEIPSSSFVALMGLNGSGKSTLLRALSDQLRTQGIVRDGIAGLGRPGGTAVIFQRPESQVLGVTVRDDLLWGLDADEAGDVDVAAALARVGLSGLAHQETGALSGGQLQRLAVAAALARKPALLLSDESTSMLDAAGRAALVGVLRTLPKDAGVSVVHATHREQEAIGADLVVVLDRGHVVRSGPPQAVLTKGVTGA